MERKVDAIGKKYGKLLVLEEISVPYHGIQKNRRTMIKLKCRCECGEIVITYKGNILYGKTKQCKHCQNAKLKIGDKKGALTILSRAYEGEIRKYLCKCNCGYEDLYRGQFLTRNKNPCCKNCKPPKKIKPIGIKKTRHEAIKETNFKKHLIAKSDLIGKKNGRLKIISFSHWEQKENRRRAYYKAKCKCGNEIIIRGLNNTKSCGCLQKDSSLKGENNGNAKLTNDQANAIREFKKSGLGYTNRQIADIFKINESQVSSILLGKIYN